METTILHIFNYIKEKDILQKYEFYGRYKAVIMSDTDYFFDILLPEYIIYINKNIGLIELLKKMLKDSIASLDYCLHQDDLDELQKEIFQRKIDKINELIESNDEEKLISSVEKDLSWFFHSFLIENQNRKQDFQKNVVYISLMESEFCKYDLKIERKKYLENYIFDDVVEKYARNDINILVEDAEFYKNRIKSLDGNVNIICNQANRCLKDKRIDVYFQLNIKRFLLETLAHYYDLKLIKKIAFKVNGMTEKFFIFDSIDHGAKLRNDIGSLPELSKFFDLNNYENSFWIKHDKHKKHLTFEETCQDFEIFEDDIVTQLVHLEYFEEEGEYFISHLDHEYIVYTLDQYSYRLKNNTVKGYKKVKTFKIDHSRIPFFSKYKSQYFLFIVLNSLFSNKQLLKEYFENII